MPGRILIIDDDAGFASALARHLRRGGHDVMTGESAAEARRHIKSADADVVVLDWQLPDADGLMLLDELRPVSGGAVFVMATAYPDVEIAVEAMRRGAFDYLSNAADATECVMRIERGVEVALLRRRVAEASKAVGAGDFLIGDSPPMNALRTRLDAVSAASDTTVAIVGETGTGKGVVARYIHTRSPRAYEPFVAVDCTTIPPTLVESELFGHEKGSFSGAVAAKMGRVEAAGRGTLFLDEIGEIPLGMQAKLLRLLEERELTRVGGTKPRRVEARILAATNRNLDRAVAEGRFRADLRYRLEVFVVETPPLRDRGDDIAVLAAHFAADRARSMGRPGPRLHADVVRWLLRYPFPGNVRELRNMIEQAVLLSTGDELTLEDFPVLARLAAGWAPPEPTRVTRAPPPPSSMHPVATMLPGRPPSVIPGLDDIRRSAAHEERGQLIEALRKTRGNVAMAARSLGLSRFQLLRRLKKQGLR